LLYWFHLLYLWANIKNHDDLATAKPNRYHFRHYKKWLTINPVVINPGRFSDDTVTYHLGQSPWDVFTADYGRFVRICTLIMMKRIWLLRTLTSILVINKFKTDKLVYLMCKWDTFDQEVEVELRNAVFTSRNKFEADNYLLNLFNLLVSWFLENVSY
jgi:hypothetical protein